MAEVMSKTSMLSSPTCNSSSGCFHHHLSGINACNTQRGVSYLPFRSVSFPSQKLYRRCRSFPSSSGSDVYGRQVGFRGQQASFHGPNPRAAASNSKMNLALGRGLRWWEKGLQPNMKEVSSAQDLVDSLLGAGDKLVIVDFYSPGCGGCKALHPKICQLAEQNPDVQFLQVNYEEHKSMCYALNVHVLPFFRFYRGAHGRLCSFSCTNATIKKFRDALAKHSPDRCSLGPPKGLEEKELVALAANRDLSFDYVPNPQQPTPLAAEEVILTAGASSAGNAQPPLPLPRPLSISSSSSKAEEDSKKNKMVSSGR